MYIRQSKNLIFQVTVLPVRVRAKLLLEAMKENTILQSLNNNLSSSGASVVSEYLKVNTHLQKIDLSGDNFTIVRGQRVLQKHYR